MRTIKTMRPGGDLLNRFSWYARLPMVLRRSLLADAHLLRVPAGKWLYGTGDPPAGLYGVVEGVALMYVALPRGDDVLVHAAIAGEFFGHAAELGRGPRLATVLAARPSMFLHLPAARLQQAAQRHPELWQALAEMLYEQLGATLQLFAQALALPTRARLALRLLQLSRGEAARVQLSQAQLAELIGTTRKTASALLRELEGAGMIRLGYREVLVLDREALGELT